MKILKTSFECSRDHLTIRGHVFRPDQSGELPAVIISHGFMSNQQSVWGYARYLASLGYAAFCFDFCGGCIKGTSDGNSEEMTVLTELDDLNAVIDHVKGQPDVQPDRIILMGCSQGGFVSGIAAARRSAQICKLILFYPALCIPDDARDGQMMHVHFDPADPPEILSKFPMKIGRCYAMAVRNMDPYQQISPYPGPVLIIHGTEDKIVDLSYSCQAQKAYGPERCHLLQIQGAGHGFKKQADRLAMDAVKEFLQDREEILTVDVQLDQPSFQRKGLNNTLTLPFHGNAESKWFRGTIAPGAADVQERRLWKIVQLRADYILQGTDYTGASCSIHIINRNTGSGWKPTVTTDSHALAFLNNADCTAHLENRKCGPVVHIFSTTPKA